MSAATPRSAGPHVFDLKIDLEQRTIRPFGEVDLATAPLLLAGATKLVRHAPGALTIDLGNVTFADSGLLHALDSIRAGLEAGNATLTVTNESPPVLRLFSVSRFRP